MTTKEKVARILDRYDVYDNLAECDHKHIEDELLSLIGEGEPVGCVHPDGIEFLTRERGYIDLFHIDMAGPFDVPLYLHPQAEEADDE